MFCIKCYSFIYVVEFVCLFGWMYYFCWGISVICKYCIVYNYYCFVFYGGGLGGWGVLGNIILENENYGFDWFIYEFVE